MPATFDDLPFRLATFRVRNRLPVWCPATPAERQRLIDSGEAGTDTSGRHLATPVAFDNDYPRFFLIYTDDCYHPPLYVVRASDSADAIEYLLDAHADVFALSEEDLKKREADGTYDATVGWSDNGVQYDQETLTTKEVELDTVHYA